MTPQTGLVEVYETGIHGKTMVYVGVEPQNQPLLNKLSTIKKATGTYHEGLKIVGYHWLLHPITVAKLKLDKQVVKLMQE